MSNSAQLAVVSFFAIVLGGCQASAPKSESEAVTLMARYDPSIKMMVGRGGGDRTKSDVEDA